MPLVKAFEPTIHSNATANADDGTSMTTEGNTTNDEAAVDAPGTTNDDPNVVEMAQ